VRPPDDVPAILAIAKDPGFQHPLRGPLSGPRPQRRLWMGREQRDELTPGWELGHLPTLPARRAVGQLRPVPVKLLQLRGDPLLQSGYVAAMAVAPHVLAIDLGTSGPKVALVGSDGAITANSFAPVDLVLEPGGGAEQDPEQWWRAVGIATREIVAGWEGTVSAVSVTGQWSGTVPVGREGAIGNAIIWMDARGERYIPDLIGGLLRIQGYDPRKLRRWIGLTGGAPSGAGKDPIAHILYLRHERPEVYRETVTFLEPTDYLNFRLTGVRAASFDSIALHWVTDNRDPDAVAYDDRLLDWAGIDRSLLPDLHRATDVIGTVTAGAADHLGIAAGVPVVCGTPDVHSAAIGAGTTRDRSGHVYVGTSSWLSCFVPFKKTDLTHNMASLPAPIPHRYLVADEQETAGKALDWIAAILYGAATPGNYTEMNQLAAGVAPGSGGVVFTPWLYGERTPVEDATLRAGFFNQSLETGRAEMIRAVMEGVACNSRWLLGYVEKFVKQQLDPIVMVGGGARSELWCQIYADVLGRTIRQADQPIMVNLRGAGLLAHATLGNVSWNAIPDLVPIAATFEPDTATARRYEDVYETFRRIHRSNRRTYRRLNRGNQ